MIDAVLRNARPANDNAPRVEDPRASDGLFVEWVRSSARRVRPGQPSCLTLLAIPCREAC